MPVLRCTTAVCNVSVTKYFLQKDVSTCPSHISFIQHPLYKSLSRRYNKCRDIAHYLYGGEIKKFNIRKVFYRTGQRLKEKK